MECVLLVLLLSGLCVAVDRNFTIGFETVMGRESIELEGEYSQCYVDVIVYNSTSFTYGLPGATVTILIGPFYNSNTRQFMNYTQGTTDAIGKTCIPVPCRTEARAFVDMGESRLYALDGDDKKKNLPEGFRVDLEKNNEVAKFFTYAWGNIDGREGPVYSSLEKSKCQTAGIDNSYISFSYISVPDTLKDLKTNRTGLLPGDPDFNYMWHYGPSGRPTKTCYLKINIKVQTTQAYVSTSSFLEETDTTRTLLGTFETGFQYNPTSSDRLTKAACVQFRCPAKDVMRPQDSLSTYLEGHIVVPGKSRGCCPTMPDVARQGLFLLNSASFSTNGTLIAGDDYGSKNGIYIHENPDVARTQCYTGYDYLAGEYAMNVANNYAFLYDCSDTCFL